LVGVERFRGITPNDWKAPSRFSTLLSMRAMPRRLMEAEHGDWIEPRDSPTLQPGPYACVRVRDTGPGIAEYILENVFEPFFTSKGEAGTGLGLSQVYGVMRQIGGIARVSSPAGAGATIELLFLCAEGASFHVPREQGLRLAAARTSGGVRWPFIRLIRRLDLILVQRRNPPAPEPLSVVPRKPGKADKTGSCSRPRAIPVMSPR
jgi:hypothetical protein